MREKELLGRVGESVREQEREVTERESTIELIRPQTPPFHLQGPARVSCHLRDRVVSLAVIPSDEYYIRFRGRVLNGISRPLTAPRTANSTSNVLSRVYLFI